MTTTHAVSRSTTGLRAALLNKVAADSGHVAPGVDVFGAYRFTRNVFRPVQPKPEVKPLFEVVGFVFFDGTTDSFV